MAWEKETADHMAQWHAFTRLVMWGTGGVLAIVAAMAIFLV